MVYARPSELSTQHSVADIIVPFDEQFSVVLHSTNWSTPVLHFNNNEDVMVTSIRADVNTCTQTTITWLSINIEPSYRLDKLKLV